MVGTVLVSLIGKPRIIAANRHGLPVRAPRAPPRVLHDCRRGRPASRPRLLWHGFRRRPVSPPRGAKTPRKLLSSRTKSPRSRELAKNGRSRRLAKAETAPACHIPRCALRSSPHHAAKTTRSGRFCPNGRLRGDGRFRQLRKRWLRQSFRMGSKQARRRTPNKSSQHGAIPH